MSDSPFSDDKLKQAIEHLPDLPPEQVNVGVTAKNGDIGAELEANKQLGKGFFVEADAAWWRKAGYSVAAMFGWKGK